MCIRDSFSATLGIDRPAPQHAIVNLLSAIPEIVMTKSAVRSKGSARLITNQGKWDQRDNAA